MSAAPYPFARTDAGRAQSRRPKQRHDCTVRALALVTDANYDDAYTLLATDAGRISGDGCHLDRWLYGRTEPAIGEPLPMFGYLAERLSFPARRGHRRMNPATFTREYSAGRFIVRTAGHVFAVIDGIAYDTHPEPPDRCIYVAWRFFRADSQEKPTP